MEIRYDIKKKIWRYRVMAEGCTWEVRTAYKDEWQDAMAMVWKTFLKYDAEDYTEEGIEHFRDFITDSVLHRMFLKGSYEVMVAIEGRQIIGAISVRNRNHISLLFVDGNHQKKGVGRSLLAYLCNYLLTEAGVSKVTVNASPYGVDFYHRMGFRDTGIEMTQGGIRYTPMEFVL